jgi:hypothetical protein
MPGVIYLGTSGNTKAMADAIVKGASSRNVDAKAVNFHEAKTGVVFLPIKQRASEVLDKYVLYFLMACGFSWLVELPFVLLQDGSVLQEEF